MAEEKKSPNLKDRLKKTAAASGAVTPPHGDPGAAISGVGEVGVPGLGGDLAPPAFVQQQQAQAQAAAAARAAAEDPFGAAPMSAAGPQEVRLVFDDKPVDDKEIGRKRTGGVIAIAATAVLALGGGFAIGGLKESKDQERQTLAAVTELRSQLQTVGTVIATLKEKVDRAAERGNIQVTRGGEEAEGEAPAATHPPEIDEDFITWAREQTPDSPLSPEVYAGRVGRLRGSVVSKVTLVQLQLNNAWDMIQRHSRTDVTRVRSALTAANPQTNELNRMAVSFARGQQGVMAQLVLAGAPTPQGLPISGTGIPANQTRTLYQQGDIRQADLANIAIPVNPQVGMAAQVTAGATQPWVQYRERITELKRLTDQLAQNHEQLMQSLSGSAPSGH
jgi:hypothetical protein